MRELLLRGLDTLRNEPALRPEDIWMGEIARVAVDGPEVELDRSAFGYVAIC